MNTLLTIKTIDVVITATRECSHFFEKGLEKSLFRV